MSFILHIRCIGCCNSLSAATKWQRPALCAFVILLFLWIYCILLIFEDETTFDEVTENEYTDK